jgi:hypothetical protein
MPTEAERSSVVEIIPKGLGRYVTLILRLMLHFPNFSSFLFLPSPHSVFSLFTSHSQCFLSLSLLPISSNFLSLSPSHSSTKSSSQRVHITYVTWRHTHQTIPIRVPQNCREFLGKFCSVLFCPVLSCPISF